MLSDLPVQLERRDTGPVTQMFDFDSDFDLDAFVLWFFHDNGIKIIAAAEIP